MTFGAGTNLYQLPALLDPLGLALTNMGDIDRQTLAGAISTGTHGTGARFGGLASQIVAALLVLADGSLLYVSETENAELLPAALRAINELSETRGWRISFPIEVRVAAAGDNWLSTAYGRASGYIAVHRYYREDPTEYFEAVEEILTSFDGRLHWGKMHTRDARSLAAAYPRFSDFLAVRDQLDPDRRFANPYLERVLGA